MKRLKKYRKWKWILFAVGVLLSYGPMLAMVIHGFIEGQPGQKFTLGSTVVTAAILFLLQLKTKKRLRSVFWLILIGVYVCLNNVGIYLGIITGCTLVDELIVEPLHEYCVARYNKIDQAREVYEYERGKVN